MNTETKISGISFYKRINPWFIITNLDFEVAFLLLGVTIMRSYILHGEELPFTDKVSPASCLGYRVLRPLCSCCGGSQGVRRAWRKLHHHDHEYRNWKHGKPIHVHSKGHKPKNKDHRHKDSYRSAWNNFSIYAIDDLDPFKVTSSIGFEDSTVVYRNDKVVNPTLPFKSFAPYSEWRNRDVIDQTDTRAAAKWVDRNKTNGRLCYLHRFTIKHFVGWNIIKGSRKPIR